LLVDFLPAQSLQRIRKFDPLVCLVQEVIGNSTGLIPSRFVVGYRNPDIRGRIQSRLVVEVLDHRLNCMSGVEYVVHDQQAVFVSDPFNQVVHTVNTNGTSAVIDTAAVRRGPDGNVIGIDAEIGKQLLNRNSYWRTTTPDGDDGTGPESALDNS